MIVSSLRRTSPRPRLSANASARLRAAIAACGLLLTGTAAAQAGQGIYFTHHDWEVACDNTRTCRVAGYTSDAQRGPDDAGNGASVLFTRAAGRNQAVSGQLRFADWYEEVLPRAPVHLRIDGRDLGQVPAPASGEDPLVELEDAQVRGLLAALLRSSDIALVDAAGARWPLSDAGAAAVLLKMDEFQGRLGTTGALARTGTRDESAVLPPLPVPRIRRAAVPALRAGDTQLAALPAVRQALRASMGDGDCIGLGPGEDERPLQVDARLDGDHVLVSTTCWLGAYNSGTGYWVMGDQAPYPARLVTSDAVDYDNGYLHGAHKGRGLGDCYWTGEWVWDGRDFVQASEATSGLCRGIAAGGAWDLPTRVSEVVD